MQRPLTAALLLGVLDAAAAVMVLVVEAATPDEFGWFTYAPQGEVVIQDPRFPWDYVVLPLALVLTNALVVPRYVRTVLGR